MSRRDQSSGSPNMQKARHVMPHPNCTVIILSSDASQEAHFMVGGPTAPFADVVADGELVQGNRNAGHEVTINSARISVI